MRFFLAGIMQGSRVGMSLHDQHYRAHLAELVTTHFAGAEIYDPLVNHQESVDYDEATGRSVFYEHNRMCREVDVLIAFVPEASMGTAIEMWEAHEHGRGVVIAISPLKENWAVRYCSHILFADLGEFQSALESGDVQRQIAARRASADRGPSAPTQGR